MGAFKARLLVINSSEQAQSELRRIGVDPAGIGLMQSKMVARCIHLAGLQCRQANILKQEMLALGGDAAVARGTVGCSIDFSDVILIGTDKQLRKLCVKLQPQPFGLPDLAAELTVLLGTTELSPAIWTTSKRSISLKKPLIMGILNVTPDSFSDGGHYSDPDSAFERARRMVDQGADIIDIGGESTRPGAPPIDHEEEIRRVVPVIEKLSGRIACPVSIDTWKASVARRAMDAGAEIINDVSGCTFDQDMPEVMAQTHAGVVLMHTRGKPDTMQRDTTYRDLLGEVVAGLAKSLETAIASGVSADRIVLDPGIGFAKDLWGNLEILRRLRELGSLGRPILVGSSRKAFIGRILDRDKVEDRLFGTAATVALAVANGASILRVHDIAEMRDVARMADAIAHHTP